jgi:hypothetical protein
LGSARSEATIARRSELRRALAFAIVPVAATALLGMLLFPRQAMPDGLPLPIVDPQGLRQAFETDTARAAQGHRALLPGAVRALGSALRDFHALEVKRAQPNDLDKARRAIDVAFVDAQPGGAEPLLILRAVQLEAFVAEVDRFVSTGVESPELSALAGGFVRTMRSEGWCEGHRLLLTEPELRASFKQMWNSVLGVDDQPAFALALDEQRSLFALRLSRPHLPARVREAIAAARRTATDERACAAVDQSETRAIEHWSIEHINRLAAVDPTYPAGFARGVAQLRGGSFADAATAFREWLGDHPDGALALRARSYLRLASRAAQVE